MLGERDLATASGARARGEAVARSEEAVGAVDVLIFILTALQGERVMVWVGLGGLSVLLTAHRSLCVR